MELGAFTNLPSQNAAGASAYAKAFPGAKVFRLFHGGAPASLVSTQAAGIYTAGLVPFLSVKTSYTSVGSDDAATASLAKSMSGGGYLADWHEPENDMTPAQYVAVTRHFYGVAKPANPALMIADVAMAYQWDPGHNVPDPHLWDAGNSNCDARGIDIYSESWRSKDGGITPLPIDQLPGLRRWLDWAAPLGKPIMAVELGCATSFSDQARANWYEYAFSWLRQNGFTLCLPWNGNGTPGSEQFYYWGGPAAFPLTAAVVRAAVAPPAVNPTPWAVSITPDPTSRIRTVQSVVGVQPDGLLGEKTLTAIEAALSGLSAQAAQSVADQAQIANLQAQMASARASVSAALTTLA